MPSAALWPKKGIEAMSSTASGPDSSEIQKLFASISGGYDKANDLMTFGMARLWRKQLVKWSEVKSGAKVLDVASGTGDLALEFKKAVGSAGEVVATDFCQEMLDQAPAKAQARGLEVKFQWADALNLPFADESFDVVSIAYGIRNVSDAGKAVHEMSRVLRPGGRLMILETGDQQSRWIQGLYSFYFSKVVPWLGHVATGKKEAYEYLNRSSARFPSGENFCETLRRNGRFESVEFKSLMGGASFLYKSVKK
jgi:demethylmenaquinone methyltransferase/2-methoxy-6-polyprenyl-1,4-benzoquinol methylase